MSFNDTFKANSRRKQYDIFISHSWKHDDDYDRLEEMLRKRSNFTFRNHSIPEKKKVEGKSKLALKRHMKNRQIKPVSVVIVLAGMYSEYSDWIKREVRYAEDLDKPIRGVEPHGSKRTPNYIDRKADEVVGWHTDSIVREIRNLSP